MVKISLNENWKCFAKDQAEKVSVVTLPHDAMLWDGKRENSPGGTNTGWYDARDYIYEKVIWIPQEYAGGHVIIEFEGVYHKATVYINDKKVAYHDYGYTGFYVEISEDLICGAENTIRVEAINSDQPNSRWYTGTGIYRPVWLYYLPKLHIKPEGIRVTTLDYHQPKILVQVQLSGWGKIRVEILDGATVQASVEGQTNGEFEAKIELPEAILWSPETPYMYICRVTTCDDEQEECFGIRMVECTPQKGFCINGNRVILRGACIHHDNGILGACAYEFAERRKIRLLKENGYNAVRCAHNPCSKALLRACDDFGMLVVEEYTDMWYIHKTKYDYATEVEQHYREDLENIVSRDYNHPSVIMYSTGNEVAESAQKRGIRLCREMTEYLHGLDPTRPVTCGINIFFNFLNSMGLGVYSDGKADREITCAGKKKAVGSEYFNMLAGILGADFMKFGATLYFSDVKSRDAFKAMDIAGYNYGIFRYEYDLKKYPERIILGSETFCSDAYRFWELAKKHRRIIGDFVWAGMDYLGEVGVGSWEYRDYAPRFDGGIGWVSAGSGRLDLTGKPLCEAAYTRVAFELDEIGIGVIPADRAAMRHSPSAWKMTNAIESWSWNGAAGKKTKVEVYSRAYSIDLFINGKAVGSKKPKGDCKVIFNVTYNDGELRAISYDAEGRTIAQKILRTAREETILQAQPELSCMGLEALCYVRLRYTDTEGILKPLERSRIRVTVEGGHLLGLGSACPYYPESYLTNTTDTYYGEALAVIKPEKPGTMRIYAESALGSCMTEVTVRENREDG